MIDLDLLVARDCFAAGLAITTDVLATANLIASRTGAPRPPFTWRVLSVDGTAVRSSAGLRIAADGTWASAEAPFRMAFGVGMADHDAIQDYLRTSDGRALVEALARGHQDGATLLASCSSTFLLAETGALDHGAATTSWWLAPLFRRRYPAVHLAPERLVTEHDRVVCAGAAMAQLDLALHLVRRHAGMELARLVARYLVIDDDRVSQAPYLILDHLQGHDEAVRRAQDHARAHLRDDPSIGALAHAAAVSPRTLRRRFAEAVGMSPARYVQRLRAETARTLLQSTDWSVGRIAHEVGYSEDGALRRALRTHFDTSPSALRR